jgi:hypothetical protein
VLLQHAHVRLQVRLRCAHTPLARLPACCTRRPEGGVTAQMQQGGHARW